MYITVVDNTIKDRQETFKNLNAGAFEDDDVTHVEGDVNPVRDLEIISEELRLKDIEFLNGHLEKLEKLVVRGNDKKLKPEYVSTKFAPSQKKLRCGNRKRVSSFDIRVKRGKRRKRKHATEARRNYREK